jgi:hypothetical protein
VAEVRDWQFLHAGATKIFPQENDLQFKIGGDSGCPRPGDAGDGFGRPVLQNAGTKVLGNKLKFVERQA